MTMRDFVSGGFGMLLMLGIGCSEGAEGTDALPLSTEGMPSGSSTEPLNSEDGVPTTSGPGLMPGSGSPPPASPGSAPSSSSPGVPSVSPTVSANGGSANGSGGGATATGGNPATGGTAAGGFGNAQAQGGLNAGGRVEPSSGGDSAGGAAGAGSSGVPGVRLIGRFVDDGDGGQRFEWSGSGVIAAFEGETVSIALEDGGSNQFTVLIDGELMPTLRMQAGSNTYELAIGLAAGEHIVEVYRRTEASFGTSVFRGFSFGAGGQLLAPPPAQARKLEIIGDSISCGYGNEGESATCGFSAETENHYLTYGAIAARALEAEVVTIAWSGKGIVYNYDTDTTDPLPALYDRVLPTQGSSAWDFSSEPDAVIINLGTNDFSTDDDPSAMLFHERYLAFLEHLRDVYPGAFILCTVGPLLNGADLEAARAGIESAVLARQDAGDARVKAWLMNVSNDAPGCDYHPSVATHQAMAEALAAELRTELGW